MKHTVARWAERFGYEIRRQDQARRWLAHRGFASIIDIGANEGQFAQQARKALPDAWIHSFEPAEVPYARLVQAFQGDARFQAYPAAVGEEAGPAALQVNAFSPSSSLLPLAAAHREAFDFAQPASSLRVEVVTLDAWAAQRPLPGPLLVKIDVQGFEDRVLRGGWQTLARASALLIEVSFVELYEGQWLFAQLDALLAGRGFQCSGFLDTYCHPKTGVPLSADAWFERVAAAPLAAAG
jgi:FkbM family methyltransferase